MLFRLGPVVARLAVDVLQVEPDAYWTRLHTRSFHLPMGPYVDVLSHVSACVCNGFVPEVALGQARGHQRLLYHCSCADGVRAKLIEVTTAGRQSSAADQPHVKLEFLRSAEGRAQCRTGSPTAQWAHSLCAWSVSLKLANNGAVLTAVTVVISG
jgi:hypothetical protein